MLLLAGCATKDENGKVDDLCYRGICGCWQDYTMRAVIKITGADTQPAPGLSLECEATQKQLGVTNESGIVQTDVKGRTSPGCGFAAKCESAIMRSADGRNLGTFSLTPLLRGHAATTGKYRIESVTE